MLKILGPQVGERKNSFRSIDGSSSKSKPQDPIALYMMYQQQHYLNSLMLQTKEKVLGEGKVLLKTYKIIHKHLFILSVFTSETARRSMATGQRERIRDFFH